MSIIESAFLKNQNGSNPELLKESKPSENTKRSNFSAPQAKRLGSVRDDIAEMTQFKIFSKKELLSKGLIYTKSRDSKLVNEYRNLRTKLLSVSDTKNFITLVTSVHSFYDSSTISANMAATFALDSGKTSLLLNADESSQKLNEIFEVQPEFGLVDFISSKNLPVDKIIHETPIPRLRYIPLGHIEEGYAELFSDTRMEMTMQSLISRYPERYLVINAPSIASSADTRILLNHCHKVVLVVPYGLCSEEDISQAVSLVGKEKLAGVILDEF